MLPAAPAGGPGFTRDHTQDGRENLVGTSGEDLEQQIEAMYDKADDLMINQENFVEAKALYLEILELEPENIDGLNSVAACIKYLTPPEQSHFEECLPYYQKALEADPEDFETNFNIGVLYYDQKHDA